MSFDIVTTRITREWCETRGRDIPISIGRLTTDGIRTWTDRAGRKRENDAKSCSDHCAFVRAERRNDNCYRLKAKIKQKKNK